MQTEHGCKERESRHTTSRRKRTPELTVTEVDARTAGTLLAPTTQFFVLGFAAGLAKSELQIPEAIGKGLAIYLMLAIGFKSGTLMAEDGGIGMLGAMVAGIVLRFTTPAVGFALLRATAGA